MFLEISWVQWLLSGVIAEPAPRRCCFDSYPHDVPSAVGWGRFVRSLTLTVVAHPYLCVQLDVCCAGQIGRGEGTAEMRHEKARGGEGPVEIRKGQQTPLSRAKRQRLDKLWSSHDQALWKRMSESDFTCLHFCVSPVGKGLENNAWGYVARQVARGQARAPL